MKGKILVVGVILVGVMLIVNATNLHMKAVNTEIKKLNEVNTLVKPANLQPAPVALSAKPVAKKVSFKPMPLDTQVTVNEGVDQNPAIATDGSGNILSIYEIETDISEYDIGISASYDVGSTWGEAYYFEVDGDPTQPRLDFYGGKTVYGTWTADPWEAFGYAYFAEFPDITDPEAGEYGWVYFTVPWGENYGIGAPFTSSDVGCYETSNPPTPAFWGIVGFTGDNEYSGYEEDNTFMFQFDTEEGYVTIIFFYDMDFDVFNISTDIDQSNGQFYMVADFVSESDPSVYGTYVLTRRVTSSEDWWQGSWEGVLFYNCTHPYVEASNGRVYVATEMKMPDGSSDIVCWTTTNPSNWQSWEGLYVTSTTGESERFPALTAIDDKEAIIVFVKDNNVYATKTVDSAQSWSPPDQVNDNPSTAVGQYGCLDVAASYALWTDTSTGNYDILFDIVGKAPVIDIAISGGFGVKATISNIGTGDASNVQWSIDITGGIVLKGHAEGTIASLPAGSSTTVSSGLVLGIGPVTVTVTAGGASKTASGFMLGPFILGLS
ncbi:MAG TPA: hypothetical protein ENI33_05895 [Thermoplasmatales archaeon]|nr:hypothetical protein [Thermoplasmatales archaeon]